MVTTEIRTMIEEGHEPRVRFRKGRVMLEGVAEKILKSRKGRMYVALRTNVPDPERDQMHPMRVHLNGTKEWELLT